MAPRAVAIIPALLVAGLVLAPLTAVLIRGGGPSALGPADWAALRFTLVQALVSSALSVGLAIPVARALARRRFPGRGLLITLLGAPFILPVLVAVLGLLAVFGQNGWLSALLGLLGLPPVQVYGLHGVVLAHVFFNLPLATRLILQGWLAIPAERLRTAATLDLPPLTVFRLIEGPLLRRVAPGAALIVFTLCLSSFAVALTLGGGPASTTIELAIYQSFRFDFDLSHAATLATVQLALVAVSALLLLRLPLGDAMGSGLDRTVRRWDAETRNARFADTAWVALAAAFLLLPLLAIALRGVPGFASLPGSVWQAAGFSLAVALASTLLCLALALPLSMGRGEGAALLGLAISPLVLGTGMFLLIQPFASPFTLALPVTALVNALMALPFALRALRPEVQAITAQYGPLAQSLDLGPRGWTLRILLPRLRRPLGFSAGLGAALSMGDLGVIALFADPDRATLPLQMYRLMQGYRMESAAAAALLLLALSLGLFWIFDRGGRADADA